MKKHILFVIMLLAVPAIHAQDKPAPAKEPTVAELKLQLAQKDLQIAQLNAQVLQVQGQLVQVLSQQAQGQIQSAQKAVADATPKPVPNPQSKIDGHEDGKYVVPAEKKE